MIIARTRHLSYPDRPIRQHPIKSRQIYRDVCFRVGVGLRRSSNVSDIRSRPPEFLPRQRLLVEFPGVSELWVISVTCWTLKSVGHAEFVSWSPSAISLVLCDNYMQRGEDVAKASFSSDWSWIYHDTGARFAVSLEEWRISPTGDVCETGGYFIQAFLCWVWQYSLHETSINIPDGVSQADGNPHGGLAELLRWIIFCSQSSSRARVWDRVLLPYRG